MKKLPAILCIFVFMGSCIPSFALQEVVSRSRILSEATIAGINMPYISPVKNKHYHNNNGIKVYGSPRNKYVTQRFNGYENNRFPRRSYYIPSYCLPEASVHNWINNPFCTQYRPYGSSIYVSF